MKFKWVDFHDSYDKLRLLRVDRKSSAGDIAAKFKYGKVELLKFLEKIDENRNCQEDSNLKNDSSVRYVNMETHQKRDDMNDSINQLLIRVLIQSELGPEVKDLIMFCNLYKVYHDKSNAKGWNEIFDF